MTPEFKVFGDAALLVEFGEVVDPAINALVIALDQKLTQEAVPGVVELAPSFRSLLVQFDPLVTDASDIRNRIEAVLGDLQIGTQTGRHWILPACYEGDLAPDLELVAQETGVGPAEIVAAHSGTVHQVYMLGFLPGCPYLGGVPDTLNLPRRKDPRLKVPKGSIGLAVGLSVIYPTESPGGWNLIGRTPVEMFDPSKETPALLAPGDRITFEPIGKADYDDCLAAVQRGEQVARLVE